MSRLEACLLRAHEADVRKHGVSEANFAGNLLPTECFFFSMHVRQDPASDKGKSAAYGKLGKISPLGTFLLCVSPHSMLIALPDSHVSPSLVLSIFPWPTMSLTQRYLNSHPAFLARLKFHGYPAS